MRVVEILTQEHQQRYVVIDDEGILVEPIARYLKYLDRTGSALRAVRSAWLIQNSRYLPILPNRNHFHLP